MSVDIELQRRRVIARRKATGLSQRQVAEIGAIPQVSLSRIEAGTKAASVPELLGIAYATGTPIAYLTGGSELEQRVQFAARAADGADTTGARERLLYLLEMDARLDIALK